MLTQSPTKNLLTPAISCLLLTYSGISGANSPAYCNVETGGNILITRPQADEAINYIDDINWFARPVPNPNNDYIIGFASHNQNYLYNLNNGKRVAIPDKSDAVATPDGRFITVPSHYTPNGTVNFYDTETLLTALEKGKDAKHTKAVFKHDEEVINNTFYQSAGVISSNTHNDGYDVSYRMMFSGNLPPNPPGFLITDYHVTHQNGKTRFKPSPILRLCPEIIDDMATPFISKDGRYIVAHDNSNLDAEASLKLFEITDVDYKQQTTSCKQIVDFGFRAGKADFSFDNSQLTFHLSTNDYITTFINGGLDAPHITDVVVVNLEQDKSGNITGYKNISRLTTSTNQGVGNYFPSFLPDGNLFYIANKIPRSEQYEDERAIKDRRFEFHVLSTDNSIYRPNVFSDASQLSKVKTIGRLWQQTCLPYNNILPGEKAAWNYLSLNKQQCAQLINEKWQGDVKNKQQLLSLCESK